MKIDDLKAKLTSESIPVLNLCNQFLDQRIEKERLRGEAAESRANIILTACGAASAFLVFFINKLPDVTKQENIAITLIYVAAVLWLSKSVWYSIKSIHMQSRKQVVAESIFEFQEKDELIATKMVISSKLWELQQTIQPNTERLFYVQRAQRALIFFIAILLIEGLALATQSLVPINQSKCAIIVSTSVIILVFIIIFFFGDKFIEKRGIWNHN